MPHVFPSNVSTNRFEEMSWGFLCYNYGTGRPSACGVTLTLGSTQGIYASERCVIQTDGTLTSGTCADGGHLLHTITRPRILNTPLLNPQLDYPGDLNPDPFVAEGPTSLLGWRYVRYPTPQNAGFFHWSARITSARGWLIGIGAQPDGSILMEGTVEISHRDLRQLPDINSVYVKGRRPSSTITHIDPEAFGGTETTIEAMRLISEQYATDTGTFLLSINDMSLPLGGVFDLSNDWLPDHVSHRDGQDVDINRRPFDKANGQFQNNPIRCEDDIDFVRAVNKVLVPKPGRIQSIHEMPIRTAVLCESKGGKHIDITSIIPRLESP